MRSDGVGANGDVVVVARSGLQSFVQDQGRRGRAKLGVPASGAADVRSAAHANELVGNEAGAAVIETIALGRPLQLHFGREATVAVTGAPATITVDDQTVELNAPFVVGVGAELTVARPTRGLRNYIAVAGGFDVPLTLGSRSTDVLTGLGPAPLQVGDMLPIGSRRLPTLRGRHRTVPIAVPARYELGVIRGPRDDLFTDVALADLFSQPFVVTPASNRVALRLQGPKLVRRRDIGVLPSEGVVAGALQVTGDGQVVLFMPDHPVTGGYPVIGVVRSSDRWLTGQARPGTELWFTEV